MGMHQKNHRQPAGLQQNRRPLPIQQILALPLAENLLESVFRFQDLVQQYQGLALFVYTIVHSQWNLLLV